MNNCRAVEKTLRLNTRHRTVSTVLYIAFLGTMLAGCEAALDLSAVNDQLSQPTYRSDLFQATASYQDTVVAVGGMGTIVQSTDGGASWQRSSLARKPFLVDVTVCPDGSFHSIEKTDGIWSMQPAGNWLRQSLPEMTEPQAMTCDFANGLWVTGGFSTILNSGDGGSNWKTWSLDEDLYLTTIQFTDQLHGVVTGEFGTVLISNDGGLSWSRADDLPDSFYPQSAYFANPATGWVVGLNGTIWETVNGGQSWLDMRSGISTPLYGIAGLDNTLVAVGDNATILYHKMGEAGWSPFSDATKSRTYLRGVTGLGNGQFIAAGGGGALFAVTIPHDDTQPNAEVLDE